MVATVSRLAYRHKVLQATVCSSNFDRKDKLDIVCNCSDQLDPVAVCSTPA